MLLRIIVSGEGPTDFGRSKNEQLIATNEDFEQGPLFLLLQKLLDQHLPNWNKEQDLFKIFIYRKALGDLAKDSPVRFPSKDKAIKGHLEHTERAYALAQKTKEITTADEGHIAVYFHDTDGTQVELQREPDRQSNRVKAINLGFATASYKTGVAMVPKPTSEAWLYCSCKKNPYQHCQRIETDWSGNDRSPERSPKVVLANAISAEKTNRVNLSTVVEQLDITKIDMPSFNQFRDDLKNAIRNVCGSVEE
jgi:hypothetical protein